MSYSLGGTVSRSIFAVCVLAICMITAMSSVADANRRARNSVRGAAIGAGVGALIDGGQGARTGAAVGAVAGAVARR